MIQIGDFSRLSRVSVKTLRYYDELGLIKPVHVDQFTGYRYYAHDQYVRLNRILALKDLGFPLEQIGRLLDAGLSSAEIRGMLVLRRLEIEARIQAEGGRLARIDAWLSQLKREDSMSDYDVVVKRVPAIKVASVRGVVLTPPEQGLLWKELESYLKDHQVTPAGPWLALYHNDGSQSQDWDIEVCEPVSTDLPEGDTVRLRELAAVETMACTLHRGPFMTLSEAYGALGRWLNENGYSLVGPCREVGLRNAKPEPDPARVAQGIVASQTDPETVIEVQFPVEKQ